MLNLKFIFLTFFLSFTLSSFVTAQEQSKTDLSITKDLQPGKAIEMPKPRFPATAKALGISGQVNVIVKIDKNGDVISAIAKTGHPLLIPAAIEAAKLAKFTPTTLNGETIIVTGTIAYNFIRNPNWEKIGNSLGSIENQVPVFGDDSIESDFISKELNELKEELDELSQKQDNKEKARLAAKVINSIYQKLSIQEPTSAWYFRLGVIRSKFTIKTGEESS
ncbi:MAG: energy transducer TonB, partial [Acidobacteriota bacterium]|nr:energy transducer TonB [Acidobacteriota bacterium]